MSMFTDRLQQAARFIGVSDRQAAIADALGLKKQTVNRWFMTNGEPSAAILHDIAKKWNIDPYWLKSGTGTMLPVPSPDGLTAEERDLIKNYRMATPKVREVLQTMVKAARKSIIALSLAIPPYLCPQPADASTLHIKYSASVIRIGSRLLAALRKILSRPLQTLTN